VVDSGPHEVRGLVLDVTGHPVPIARVDLYWRQQKSGFRSSSHRSTTTVADGTFSLTQLGTGIHQLWVSAPMCPAYQRTLEVAGSMEVVVQLEIDTGD